jgi:MFS family permease
VIPGMGVAFVMSAVSTTLLFGQLNSNFWPKWLYIASVVVFEVGSAVCGAAHSMDMLIVGRTICGLGGMGIYLGVMTLIASTTTIQERPLYIAGTGFIWGLGTILGPIVGGAFADSSATWRWAFYINLPIGGLFAPVFLFFLPNPDPRPGFTVKQRLQQIDWVGAPLMVGAIVSFTMAINFGGIIYDWDSGSEIALWVVSGVLFIVLGVQQGFCIGTTAEKRIFPVEMLTSRKFSRTTIIMFCTTAAGGAAIFVPVYFIPLLFQFARGDSAIKAGVRLLPFICVLVFITLFEGALFSLPSGKFGLYMPWFLVGGVISVAGGALMYTVDLDSSDPYIYGASVLLGVGVGTYTQSGYAITQAYVDHAKHATASAYICLAQVGGITIGLAIANAVFLNRAQDLIGKILPQLSQDEIQNAIAGTGADLVKTLPGDVQAQVLEAIVDAVQRSYILVIAAGSLVAVLSLGMKREKIFMAAAAGV